MVAALLIGAGMGFIVLFMMLRPRRHSHSREIRKLMSSVIPHLPPVKPESAPSNLRFAGIGILFLILGVGLMGLDKPTASFNGLLQLFVLIFMSFGAVVMLLPILITFSIWRRVQEACDRGDYSEAVRIARRLNFFSVGSMLYQQASILLFAGHYDKAEHLYLEALAGEITTLESPVISLANLAWIMTRQKRYEEAEAVLHTALEVHQLTTGEIETVYSNLAEVYLYQGIWPEEALRLAQMAYQAKKESLLGSQVDRQMWGHILGNQAWALALMGQFTKAEKTLQAAFKESDPNFAPGYAGVYYRAGRVKLLEGSYKEAQIHFETAVEIAPHSAYAQLSRQALEELLPV